MEALAIANTKVDEHSEFSCSLYPLGNHLGSDLFAKGNKRSGKGTPDRI